MINRKATIRWKGYDPANLKPHSDKRVWTNCDNCGNGRWVVRDGCTDLCHSCSMKGRIVSDETRLKISQSEKGKVVSDETKRKMRVSQKGKKLSEVTKSRIGESMSDLINNSPEMLEARRLSMIGNKFRIGYCGEKHPNWKGGNVVLKCETCGRDFDVEKYRENDARFCSRDCANVWKRVREVSEIERIKMSCSIRGITINEFDGFLSSGKYCEKFNEIIKKYIRDKYNNCDYISGIHKDICNNGLNLDVHHVDYNKNQGCDDNRWVLIPLSHINHSRTGGNRCFWNKLFQYSLQYDKEYCNICEDAIDIFKETFMEV